MHAASRWPAHHHRCRRIPEVVSLGHEIRDLVECADDEIDELQLRDRPQPQIAHAARRPDDGALADGRIDHALPPETLEQSFAGLESAPIHANVLTKQDHRGITLHLFEHGLLDGFEKSDRRSVGSSHGYLFNFLVAPEATVALTDFFTGVLPLVFAGASPSLAGVCIVFVVSP